MALNDMIRVAILWDAQTVRDLMLTDYMIDTIRRVSNVREGLTPGEYGELDEISPQSAAQKLIALWQKGYLDREVEGIDRNNREYFRYFSKNLLTA